MSPKVPFRRELQFEYGVLEQVAPGVRRLVARNPGPFTHCGTGTYVLGEGQVAVVDPGPDLAEHVEALMGSLTGETITHQLVTHTHLDHSPATAAVKQATGATTYGFGPHGAGEHERGAIVEAGADHQFDPDVTLEHGQVFQAGGMRVEAVHTPGHCKNHLCFALPDSGILFTGDHVMGWSTTIVSPPDGDMGQYMASLEQLQGREDRVYWPTHGPCIDEPQPFVAALTAHRRHREAQILEQLAAGVETIQEMVPRMYTDLPSMMRPAAARSVFAHIIHLLRQGQVQTDGEARIDGRYQP